MKIVMIDTFLPNSIYSLELCEKLRKEHDVVMLCKENYQTKAGEEYVRPVFHSKSKNPIQALLLYLNDLRLIYQCAKETHADIVHFQGVHHVYLDNMLVTMLKKLGCRVVYTAHNILSHEQKANERKQLNSWYSHMDGIIVHNSESARMLKRASEYRGEVFVVPHGSYDTYSGTRIQKEENDGKISFLQFGIIRDYKGVDILLKAIALLSKEIRQKCRFVIAGKLTRDYYDLDAASMVDELGISDAVELELRRIDDDEVPDLFNRCDCCLFPYRHIYGSGALLMAYTFRKPVIASAIPVFEEETEGGKTGFLVHPEDPEDLAEKIMQFCELGLAEKEQMAAEIERLVNEKYNWTMSARKTIEAYRHLGIFETNDSKHGGKKCE